MADVVAALDSQLEQLFGAWNIWSTLLVIALLIATIYPILVAREPDTHPLLLSRQSHVGAVRQPGESAVFRSMEVPHGLPLRSGLNVKDKGASKWSAGRDGDIRDIWHRVVSGPTDETSDSASKRSSITTIHGLKDIEEHTPEELSQQINIIGSHIKRRSGTCVAIYLPNSIELLVAIFAGAFYGFHPVLLPYNQPQDVILRLIQMSSADYLIANAGTLPFGDVRDQCKNLREVMWAVRKSNRQMDWNEKSQELSTCTWHELVEAQTSSVSNELPSRTELDSVPDLITIWLNETATSGEIVAFTQNNLAAAVAAQASALPSRHRFSPDDLFFPAESLTSPYVLTQTLAALYSGSSLALNSVAGEDVDLQVATAGISPTIVAASAASAAKLHSEIKSSVNSVGKRIALHSRTQALEAGYLPPAMWLDRINAPARAALGTWPSRLRLIFVFERAHAGTPALTPALLSELRAFTNARVIYALTAAKVAGTVSQTAFYDYRSAGPAAAIHSHFGPPVSSLEIKLVDTDTHKTVDGEDPAGEVVVMGPAVSNGRANLGVLGTFKQDGTLAYI